MLLQRTIIAGIFSLLLLWPARDAFAQLAPSPILGCGAAASCQLPGTIFKGVSISWQAATTARYLMVFDSTSLPSNGSTTLCSTTQSNGCLAYCLYMPESTAAPNRFTLDWTMHPVSTRNGVRVAVSTGAGCGTLTIDGANNYFFGQGQ